MDMKPSRFTEEQIIGILREQEAGAKTPDVCRKHGVSSANFYKWKAKYGGLDVSDAKRLKSLEDENAEEAARRGNSRQCDAEGYRSKKMVTPAARREAVAHLRVAYEVSERRACSALGADRTSIRYRSTQPDDAAVRARLRELAAIRRRFGYRRLHILLTREGVVMNHKKLRRLYREERLRVRRRGGRKRALGARHRSHHHSQAHTTPRIAGSASGVHALPSLRSPTAIDRAYRSRGQSSEAVAPPARNGTRSPSIGLPSARPSVTISTHGSSP